MPGGDRFGFGHSDPSEWWIRKQRIGRDAIPHAPRATFKPIPSFSDTPSGRELGSGVDLAQVQTEHDEEPVTSGRAYVYFWPGGITERAYIQLKRPGAEDALTVVVSPLTGRTKIEKGLVDLPEPRTDKEEDQGDREAL